LDSGDNGLLHFNGMADVIVESSIDLGGTQDGIDDGLPDLDDIDEGNLDSLLNTDGTDNGSHNFKSKADGNVEGSLDFDGTEDGIVIVVFDKQMRPSSEPLSILKLKTRAAS
jgi:hypothetical protein